MLKVLLYDQQILSNKYENKDQNVFYMTNVQIHIMWVSKVFLYVFFLLVLQRKLSHNSSCMTNLLIHMNHCIRFNVFLRNIITMIKPLIMFVAQRSYYDRWTKAWIAILFYILKFLLQIKLTTGKKYCNVMENLFECHLTKAVYTCMLKDLHFRMYGGWLYTCILNSSANQNLLFETMISEEWCFWLKSILAKNFFPFWPISYWCDEIQ